MAADLNMTERRKEGLEAVRDGRVGYEAPVALYHVDGEPVGNWSRRTFSELRTAGLIALEVGALMPDTGGKTVTKVSLTELGQSTMESPQE